MTEANTWQQEYLSRVWVIGDEEVVRMQTLKKDVDETTRFTFDFSQRHEIQEGDSITAIAALTASPTELTLSDQAIDGDAERVRVTIASGTSAVRYALRCTVTTASGYTLVGKGYLDVE